MKPLPIPILAFSALFGSALLVLPPSGMADPASPAPPSPPAAAAAPPKDSADGPMRRSATNRAAFFEARLAALHAGLQLKPDQDHLWTPVEAALRDLAASAGHRGGPQGAGGPGQTDQAGRTPDTATGLDDLRQRGERMIRRGEAIGKLVGAGAPLMASLSEDQKSRLPTLIEHIGPRRITAEVFGVETMNERPDGDRRHGWRSADRQEQGGGERGFGGTRGYDGERGPENLYRDRHDRDERAGRCDMRNGFDRDDGWEHRHRNHDERGRQDDGADPT